MQDSPSPFNSSLGIYCQTRIRSYSRGAQGVLLVYDITNRWSFEGVDRWLKEIEEHAPGVPKVLVGNRLHLAYKRQVSELDAEQYAQRHDMAFFEVSPLCDFNIIESLTELSRLALRRHGMERLWRATKVLSLQELCCRAIVSRATMYAIEQLPLPGALKSTLKSYSNQRQGSQLRRIQSLHHGARRSPASGPASRSAPAARSGPSTPASRPGLVSGPAPSPSCCCYPSHGRCGCGFELDARTVSVDAVTMCVDVKWTLSQWVWM